MSANEPESAVKLLSDKQLLAAHEGLHKSTEALTSSEVAAHHYLAEELRERGLCHPDSDSEVHNAVIEMSVVRVPVASLSKRLSAKEIEAVVDMAVKNGTAYAKVHEMLTSEGWMLSASPAISEEGEEPGEMEEYGWDLTDLQKVTMHGIEQIVAKFGKYKPMGYADDAHYMGASENPFRSKGMKCVNCVAFCGARVCGWVEGDIDPEGICKLWVIPQSMLATPTSNKAVSLSLRSNQQTVLETTQKASDFKVGDFVEWDNAGGKARGKITQINRSGTMAVPETSFKIKAEEDDPAVMIRLYRPDETNGGYKVQDVLVGHKMSELRSIASLEKDSHVEEEMVAVAQKSLVYKAIDEMRFTLGPWYVPNTADAHDEWTDQLELQKSLWEYVRKGDRSIRLQHTPDTKAGEWVEAMTMPFDMEVPMTEPDTNVVSKKVFPEGTVFLGVVWEPWAWEMVKNGEIRGYSIGGSAERHEMDIPSIVIDLG